MLSEPLYSLTIAGKKWDFWKEISLSRAIDRMGGEFNVGLVLKPDEGFISETMMPGLPVQVDIDGETVLDGYIDIVNHRYDASSTSVAVVGRDKTADLIDCAATVDGPFEFYNLKLEQAIAKIIKPYGIKLTVEADTGKPFSRLAIQPGETAGEFIERACRYRAVLAVSNGIGGLAIIKPADAPSSGQIVYGQNAKEGSVTIDWTSRFSLYVLKGQQEGADGDDAETASSPEGRATDELVTRYRPTVITAEAAGYTQSLQERARWQRNMTRGRSVAGSYTVQGWYADPENKELWRPNTKVKVTDRNRNIDRELLIVSVRYLRDGSGTRTVLELALPEAYELQAEVEPKSKDTLGDA